MSALVVAGDVSGTCTLQAPSAAGSTVLTLPVIAADTLAGIAATQTLTNKTLVAPALGTPASGVLTNCTGVAKAALPAGSVLQVVNATYATQVTSTSTARVDTGLTATITPTKNTSTILVVTSCRVFVSPGATVTASSDVRLLRGATTLQTVARYGSTDIAGAGSGVQFVTSYLDSPATTSATTYKVTFNRVAGTGTVYAQLDSDMSTITLMEIAG